MNLNKTIKNLKLKIFIVTILLILTTASSVMGSDLKDDDNQITKKYYFEKPQINQFTQDNIVYDQITIDDTSGNSKSGEPDLPVYSAEILIPQGKKISEIKIKPGEQIYLGSNYNIAPGRSPVKLSENMYHSKLIKDDKIYKSENLFPDILYQEIGTYNFRGYKILILTLHPIQYKPLTGELYYFNDLEVTITTDEEESINPLFRDSNIDYEEIITKIDNPSAISSYDKIEKTIKSSDNYDLLILTTENLKDSFIHLKNKHDSQNIITKIKTLEDISLFPSSLTTEDIRDFIRDEYSNNGIEYVLIGGDDDVIPSKELWVSAWLGGDSTYMPSDLYYACLDGTYNYDGDNQWGEPSDGEGGTDVDLIAELYVGRACVGNPSEVDNFVNKTISYIDSGGYSDGDVLMVGELLWTDPITWGGDYMDQMINGSTTNYYTVGIPSTNYNIEKLYDREWVYNNWPKSEIINKINSGSKIINHLGHSSYNYNMKIENEDVDLLTNQNPLFIYSQGCNAGGFDNGDCIAEYLTVKTDKAAFAVIMNARYGWGVKGGTDGASQRYHRQFWDAIFGENITEIGKANQDSKEDNIFLIFRDCMRWCFYETNLLGDPTLTFYTTNNQKPNQPNRPTGETFGNVYKQYTFSTYTTDDDNNELYYKWDFGDGTFSEWLGPYISGEEVQVTYRWSNLGIYKVKVKARDIHRAESDWSESTTLILPIFNQFPMINLFFEILEKFFPKLYQIFEK